MPAATATIVALDVGDKRVGVAIASRAAGLPNPLITLERGPEFMTSLQNLLKSNFVTAIVVGLPRNLSGQETSQTKQTRQFIGELGQIIDLPIYWQDEAATTLAAENELRGRGQPYQKADIDALAASYILEDYLMSNEG
ncbi:MAG: Holliday junction resolvase RuvX [Candidatus Saccharimonadales bacterium]